MTLSLHRALRILLLGAYIPVSIAIGVLHSDDMPAAGDGHLTISGSRADLQQNSTSHALCLACQFTAGHFVVADDQIPVGSPEVTVSLSASVIAVASLVPLLPVRGPPSFLSL
jgi:hypothetical protein